MPVPAGRARAPTATVLRVDLLGPFLVRLGERSAGPWPRPVAKRVCGLVLVSPGRRLTRAAACEALFPNLGAYEAARSLSKALSMAHAALSGLGARGRALLQADRTHIWADPLIPLEVDVEVQEKNLGLALDAEPGLERDNLLAFAVGDDCALLEDAVPSAPSVPGSGSTGSAKNRALVSR